MKASKLFRVLVVEGVLAAGLTMPAAAMESPHLPEDAELDDKAAAKAARKAERAAKKAAKKAARLAKSEAPADAEVEAEETVTAEGKGGGAMPCGW